jgi:pyruvate formate lyase activating enzyme
MRKHWLQHGFAGFTAGCLVSFFVIPAFAAGPADGHPPPVARYWKNTEGKTVQCLLCPRTCVTEPGKRGFCTGRINLDGKFHTLTYGRPVALHMDPIEKKPFAHVMPGIQVFSVAAAGCNMRCLFCQNWQISQTPPDETGAEWVPPEGLVAQAKKRGSKFIVFTYTEPTVSFEYMMDTAKLAKSQGLKMAMHSCGYINPEPLAELLPYMDAINVDIKGFTPEFYRKMGALADLDAVLSALKAIKAAGVWLELTNLVIPGANDDPADVKRMCEWIKTNLGEDVPVHFSRFAPAFRLRNLPPTPVAKLDQVVKIAHDAGLLYVYVGNVQGHRQESTFCPKCAKIIVKRVGYRPTEIHIRDGKCEFCGTPIAGRWE